MFAITLSYVQAVAGLLATTLGIIAVLGGAAHRTWAAFWGRLDVMLDRKLDDRLDPFIERHESVLADLAALNAWKGEVSEQFRSNGGSSMKDQLDRIEAALTSQSRP